MIQQLFNEWAKKRHLWRDAIVIPPGVYPVSEPLVLDPGEENIGGNLLKVRGKGPDIVAHGVVLRPTPDFKGDCVIRMTGVHPNVYGLHVDARQVAIPFGVVMEAKDVGGTREASGGRGAWFGLTIEGPFQYAALRLLCAEEISFYGPNIYATGTGHAVALENDKFSQTAVLISGGSIYSYGADAVICAGWVNDTRIQDTFIACPFNAVNASLANDGCYNNRFDGRFECSKDSQIIVGGSRKGWSRGTTTLRVSPLVSALRPQAPVMVPTN